MTEQPFVGDNDHGDAMPTPHDVAMEHIKRQRDSLYGEVCRLETHRDDLMRERDELRQIIVDIEEGFEGCCHTCEPVGVMNHKLREERDEARRWVCIMKAMSVTYAYPPEHFAKEHGWDCFEGRPTPWADKAEADANNASYRRTDGES